MDLSKHREFFDPDMFNAPIHIIGCGAIGSTIAEQLTRLGIKELHLYDFDNVSEHNITNQMFLDAQIGMPKLTALQTLLTAINPDIILHLHDKGWTSETPLNGFVFIAVDSIETRQQIIKMNWFNPNIITFLDTRMRLTDAQHFAADWDTDEHKNFLKETMNFTSEEAKAATPVSACGTTLSVTPTVRMICSAVVANFLNKALGKSLNKTILIDAFTMNIDAFKQ